MTNMILIGIGIYLAAGLLFLGILDIVTGRIRSKLRVASIDAQSKLVATGNYFGDKTALIITLVALFLFWPIAIYGALSSLKENKTDG